MLTKKLQSLSSSIIILLLISAASLQAQQDRTMMQGFYWDVTPGGVWYDSLATYAPLLGRAGFDGIWMPPPSKSAAGGFDVGYTPYDYYDLGEYDSRAGDQTSGTGAFIPTRYGTRAGLELAISSLKDAGLEIYMDIVLNHRSGGNLEPNQYIQWFTDGGGSLFSPDGENTFTAFPLTHGSGRVAWDIGDGNEFFYPNAAVNPDNTGDFYSDAQLRGFHQMYVNSFGYGNALHDGNGQSLPVGDSLKVWGDWLTQELGLDGYRFDFVKGIHPEYFKEFMNYGAMQGKFHVHELFDARIDRKQDYLNMLNTSNDSFSPGAPPSKAGAIFDFNMRFAYKEMSDGGNNYDIREWHNRGLHNTFGVPFEQIVTFIDNHDFDRTDYNGDINAPGHSPVVNNKILAYAHMLTHPGYAQVWWRDYFNYGLRDEINFLVQVRNELGGGSYSALTRPGDGGGNPFWPGNAEEDPRHVYVAQRSGEGSLPGFVVAINKHSDFNINVWLDTQWSNVELYDLTGGIEGTIEVFEDGRALFQTQASSYHIFVPVGVELSDPPVNIAMEAINAPSGTRFLNESVTPSVEISNQSLFSQQDVGVVFRIIRGTNTLVYENEKSVENIGAGEMVSLNFDSYTFTEPGDYRAIAFIDYAADQDPSDDELIVDFTVIDADGSDDFRIDGVLNEPQYILMAEKENDNAGFGENKNVQSMYYFATEDTLFIGIEGEIVLGDNDGLGFFLDFSEVDGKPAGTPLGGAGGAVSFLNSGEEQNYNFAMDFEVDYGFALLGAQNRALLAVADYTLEDPLGFVTLSAGDSPIANGTAASGPVEDGIFPANSIRYAFLNDGDENHGFEMAIALDALGVTGGDFRAFAFIVSNTAYFSNVLLPGDAEGDGDDFGNFGFNVDFNDVEGGPFHTEWFPLEVSTSISEPMSELPAEMELMQNYPNPFNPATTIRYAVPEPAHVRLQVFNVIGQRVASLVDGPQQAGWHNVSFDASRLASGVYIYRLETGGNVLTRKMMLVK